MKTTLKELQAFVASYIAEAKQAGAWNPSVDSISGLIEKVVKTFTLDDGAYLDKLPELSAQEVAGIWEEFNAGLVPVSGRIDDGSNDELAPNRPIFDEPSYSYPLVDATTGKPGVRFKTTVDQEWFDRYINGGNDAQLVNYIIKKLYDSKAEFMYQSKRQLIGNAINKAMDAQAGETVTAGSGVKVRAGHIYKESSKFYILKSREEAFESGATFAALASAGKAVEITPDLVSTVTAVTDTESGEAFIKALKNDVEKLTLDASEGTSISGSTIGAVNTDLKLYVLPGIMNTIDVDTLAGAFNVDRLAIPAMIQTVPDFGTVDSADVFAVLVDTRGLKLADNYTVANATPVNGSLYTNYFLHYGATAFISKHTAIKVYKKA